MWSCRQNLSALRLLANSIHTEDKNCAKLSGYSVHGREQMDNNKDKGYFFKIIIKQGNKEKD